MTGEVAIRAAVKRAHVAAAQDPISCPDSDGRFPDTHLPFVLPVVVDANALRDEIIRIQKPRTILANAANSGVLRLYCASHVVDEVWEHHTEWALNAGVDPLDVRRLWMSTYLPLLRCVDVSTGLTDAAETSRLTILGTGDHPGGDPDDVPSATLALLLGVPLLSRDRCPLLAVYGQGFDYLAHANWLEQLRAGGDLGPGGRLSNLSTNLVVGAGIGAHRGVTSLVSKFGWSPVVVGALCAAAALRLSTPREKTRRLAEALGRSAGAALELLAAIFALQREAQERFAELARPEPDWHEIKRDIGSHQALQRACLYTMARAPQSTLNSAEVAELLRSLPLPARGETRVRSALRSAPGLHQPCRGRFQLGCPASTLNRATSR